MLKNSSLTMIACPACVVLRNFISGTVGVCILLSKVSESFAFSKRRNWDFDRDVRCIP